MERDPVSVHQLSSAWLSVLQSQAKLFELESALAKRSLVPLLISIAALFFLGLGLVLSTQFLVGYLFYITTQNGFISLFLLVLLDLFLICLALFKLIQYKNRMRFEHSRAALKELINP